MKREEIWSFGKVFNGKTPSKGEQRSSGWPILKIRDIDENGQFRGAFESFVDQIFYEKHVKKQLKTGDTIILNAAHNSDYVGSKNAFVQPELNGVIATGEWLIVRVEGANPQYVNQYLKSPLGRKSLKNCVKGIHLYPKDVERISVPLPPLDDQIRIAQLLSKVEGLIAQRKQHLQQFDDLLKSVFLEMFGDPIRNERGWTTEPLGDIALIERGRFSPRPRNDPKFFGGNYPFIQTGDITRSRGRLKKYTQTLNELGTKVSKEFKVGTIVIAIVGATIGETALLEISTYAPDSVIGITPNRMDVSEAIFIEYVLRFWKPVLRAKAPEAARANINIETLRPLKIVMPPDRAAFSAVVMKVDRLKIVYQNSLTDLEALYGALSQQAFNGDLDLSRIKSSTQQIIQCPTEEQSIMSTPNIEEIPAIELPETDFLIPALESRENLQLLLHHWLEAYLAQLGKTAFSVERFIAAAQTRLAECHPDNEFELGADEYEYIKSWVFEVLSAGKLTQVVDEVDNSIHLKAM